MLNLKNLLYMGPDWLSVGTDIPTIIEDFGLGGLELTSARGVYRFFGEDKGKGIALNVEPRNLKNSSEMKRYQIHFRGVWFKHRGALQMLGLLDEIPDYKISRLDYRVDYRQQGLFPKPTRGRVGEFMVDGKICGWKKFGSYYKLRNYDKTEESKREINEIYEIEEDVYRLEIEVCSKIISSMGISSSVREIVKLACNRMQDYTGIPQDCVKGSHKPPTVEGSIKHWERIRDNAILKLAHLYSL